MKKRTQMKKSMKMESAMPMEKSAAKDMKCASCACGSCANDCGAWGLTILRVIVGAAFLWHGVTKFMGWQGTSEFFSMLFGAAGPVLGGIVAGVEVLAGLALILGIWTRYASYLLIAILAVAVVWAKKFAWPQIELDIIFLGALFALAWNGPGTMSMHEKCGCCTK